MQISDDLYSVEYKWEDGGFTLKDSFILWFYRNLMRKDLIFYNVVDLEKWNPIPYFRSVRLLVAFKTSGQCVGGFWLSSYNELNKSGFFNAGMIEGAFENSAQYLRAAEFGLKTTLSRPEVQTIYGETSVTNVGVLSLADYFGFKKLGIIPNGHWHAKDGCFCDTVFMYLNKELFDRRA